jgi:hypothetical protein
MANTFRGYAQVAGVSGTLTVSAVALYPLKENMKFSHNFEEDIIKDEQGNDAAWRAFNEKFEGDIGMRLVHTGSPSTFANAKALAAALTPYAIVTISGCDIAAWNTSYQVISGSDVGLTNTTAGTMTFKLRRYADGTQNTLATSTPS